MTKNLRLETPFIVHIRCNVLYNYSTYVNLSTIISYEWIIFDWIKLLSHFLRQVTTKNKNYNLRSFKLCKFLWILPTLKPKKQSALSSFYYGTTIFFIQNYFFLTWNQNELKISIWFPNNLAKTLIKILKKRVWLISCFSDICN